MTAPDTPSGAALAALRETAEALIAREAERDLAARQPGESFDSAAYGRATYAYFDAATPALILALLTEHTALRAELAAEKVRWRIQGGHLADAHLEVAALSTRLAVADDLMEKCRTALRSIGPVYYHVESAARRAEKAGRETESDAMEHVYGRLYWMDHALGTMRERAEADAARRSPTTRGTNG